MVCDEAPAATIGGFNEKGDATTLKLARHAARRVQISKAGPISLVAAEIHLGQNQRASATAGCTATYKLRAIRTSINIIDISMA
jgi:hypothetical protein